MNVAAFIFRMLPPWNNSAQNALTGYTAISRAITSLLSGVARSAIGTDLCPNTWRRLQRRQPQKELSLRRRRERCERNNGGRFFLHGLRLCGDRRSLLPDSKGKEGGF